MHLAILSPPPECLTLVVEQYAEETPQCNQAHVRHDWRNVSRFDDPWSDEFREAISPNILVDGDGHKNAAADWLVRIDTCSRQFATLQAIGLSVVHLRVSADDSRESCDLDPRTSPPNYNDDLISVSFTTSR